MKQRAAIGLALAAITAFTAAWAEPESIGAPAARQVAPGVWLVPGGFPPDRQPDGNSVIFDAPAGLVVVDTGRHRWHREAILSLARAEERPIVAIVNTHWHLDHVSGNPDLRTEYPGLRVHASDAIAGALTGFLADSARDSAAYVDDLQIPASMRDDIRADLRTIERGAALKPDVVIARSDRMTFGGRAIEVHLVQDAVTAGDVWLYDGASRVAVLGDLVTLPAPFLDTACPEGWRNALAEVGAVPFELAVPGHGAPLTRAQFERYQGAFDAFVGCSGSARPESECAAQWADSIEPLLADATIEKAVARRLAAYYVGMLRASGGRSRHCAAPPKVR